jgi:hypothetical protein
MTKGKSKTIDAGTTTGTGRPMPARAEPIARFKLLCRRFARAARYSHRRLADPAGAVEKLPTFLPELLSAAEAPSLRPTGRAGAPAVERRENVLARDGR